LSLFCASENLAYILSVCSEQEDFRNIPKNRAQNCADSVNENSILLMATALKLELVFPFSQKLLLLQETTQSYTLNKKINSQCKIPAEKKPRS